jgi:hypothetical protein
MVLSGAFMSKIVNQLMVAVALLIVLSSCSQGPDLEAVGIREYEPARELSDFTLISAEGMVIRTARMCVR